MEGPNYEMKFTVDDVIRILKSDSRSVETWTDQFSEYLTLNTNQSRDNRRHFIGEDLMVLNYVSFHWEDEPDVQSIMSCLNAGEHHEFPFYEIIQEVTPIFIDPPDDIEERDLESSVIIGGLAEHNDLFEMARAYKLAADILVDRAIEEDKRNELICPIIFNYRHATELFLKSIIRLPLEAIKGKIGHDLLKAVGYVTDLVKSEYNEEVPEWFKNIVRAFHDFDQSGVAFRYGQLPDRELFVDLAHLKTQMTWLETGIGRIKEK